jgi:dTDP-glucose pyrophosphorylase
MIQTETGPALVILAAGLGSRFGGPKQLEPLGPGDNVLIEYTIYDAIRSGFRKVVFIIQSPFADEFESLAGSLPDGVSVELVFQDQCWPSGVARVERTRPWGTGHALLAAQHLVEGLFVLCNADDYYGASAFDKAARFLDEKEPDSTHYGMLGYRLDATLSSHGSVSRALSKVADNGYVTSVAEHPKIRIKGDIIVSETMDGHETELRGDDRVSMNFWMLTPAIFPSLDREVRQFIERNRNDPSAECRLPDVIQSLVEQGEATVECLPHDDAWFGLTHKSDYETAVFTTRSMHDDGTYPTPLWQNDA